MKTNKPIYLYCIKQSFNSKAYEGSILPVKHEIYTLRKVVYIGNKKGYLLNEINNPVLYYWEGPYELAFSPKLFMLLSEADKQAMDNIAHEFYSVLRVFDNIKLL